MKKTLTLIGAACLVMVAIAGLSMALDPIDPTDWAQDPDMDGLNNREEFVAGSDPNNWDSDGDGLPDGWEVETNLDPTDPSDAELDNDYSGGEEYARYTEVNPPYTNYDEYYRYYAIDIETGDTIYIHTNPNDPDTDGDGFLDPDDQFPLDDGNDGDPGNPGPPGPNTPGPPGPPPQDSDGDGILDWHEAFIGTDPFNPDTDGDGLSDPQEIARDLDPNDWDSDNDMLIDGVEEGGGGDSTDGHIHDTDNDGI